MKTMQINVKNMRLTGFVAAIVVAGTHPVIANANHVCEGMEEIVNVHAQDSSPFDEINTGEIYHERDSGVAYETDYLLPGTDFCTVSHAFSREYGYTNWSYVCSWITTDSDQTRSKRRRNLREISTHMKECKTRGREWRMKKLSGRLNGYEAKVRGDSERVIIRLVAVDDDYKTIQFSASVRD